jgi:hypothetical protein
MRYLYNGTVTTVLVIGEDFVEITPGQIVDLPGAPSSDFSLQQPKKIKAKQPPAPTPRSYKKRTPTKKVTTDGSDSEISILGK